jgi:hypothetical protein
MGDLIERLREKHENEVIYRQEYHLEVCAEAADALEAKDAEIARLREANSSRSRKENGIERPSRR